MPVDVLSMNQIELSSAYDSKIALREDDKLDEMRLKRAKYLKIIHDGGPWVLLFTDSDDKVA